MPQKLTFVGVVALCAAAGSAPGQDAAPGVLITEVLYSVPKGDEGDASKDGSRHATGDEFVEIHNPDGKPIRLAGWSITDRNAPDAGQFLFVFPEFSLGPGETVVVFNGLEQRIPGPVGTGEGAARSPNESFDGAWVFSAENASSNIGLANSADWVCLKTASGEVVSCLVWGDPDETPPVSDGRLVRLPKTSRGSVQLTLAGEGGSFEAHPSVEGLRCSPGKPPPPASATAAVEPDR